MHTFLALWRSNHDEKQDHQFFGLSIPHDTLVKWSTLCGTWLFIFLVLIIGVATQNLGEKGPYCRYLCQLQAFHSVR